MKRIALIAASSAAALAATFAIAQPQPVPPAGGSDGRDSLRQERMENREDRRAERAARRAERMEARLNERLAKLRTDMELKPDQVPLFERVEQVIRKSAQERRERWASMREQRENFRHADLMERLDAMANRQGERAARSKEVADAVRPLWATLSDQQKTVARRAVRESMAEGRERMRDHHERWERRGDRDDRRGDRWDRDDRRGGYGDDESGPRRWREEWRDRRG